MIIALIRTKLHFINVFAVLLMKPGRLLLVYTPRYPCLHKNSRIHQRYVKVYTPSLEPSSQPMHVIEDFDELSLNLSTVSNDSNDNMDISSVIDNGVGSQIEFL